MWVINIQWLILKKNCWSCVRVVRETLLFGISQWGGIEYCETEETHYEMEIKYKSEILHFGHKNARLAPQSLVIL
jgi:hypothetical protein